MKVRCEYCGNYLSDTEERCPNCMAPNEHLKRVGNAVPQTIEELKLWYKEHNLPSEETTRFFIGKDIKESRAFGIYYDDKKGNYVVYKNKTTGERAVRYEGKDEAYAVNELYLKLKEEIQNQKSMNTSNHSLPSINNNYVKHKNHSGVLSFFKNLLIVLIAIGIIPAFCFFMDYKTRFHIGYYELNNQLLYLYKDCAKSHPISCEWYIYDAKTDIWSQAEGTIRTPKYGGRKWNKSNRLYKKYDVKTQYYEFDWYKELHPPTPDKGYYNYNGQTYYYYYGWYLYNNGWQKTNDLDGDIIYNPSSYYDSSATSDDTYSFEDSSYYSSHSDYDDDDDDDYWSNDYDDDDWDSGSDWDSSDSWDSGGTDWDSDWRIRMIDIFKDIMIWRLLL